MVVRRKSLRFHPMSKEMTKSHPSILEAIQAKDPSIRQVHLHTSPNNVRSVCEMVEAIVQDPFIQIVSISGHHHQQQQQQNAANHHPAPEIPYTGLSAACYLIRQHANLEELRLYDLPSQHSSVLFYTLETTGKNMSSLQSLWFSPNRDVTSDEALQLCRILHFHPSLRSLSIGCSRPDILNCLKLQSCFLKTLELNIGSDMTVLRYLKPPRALKHLKLILQGSHFVGRRIQQQQQHDNNVDADPYYHHHASCLSYFFLQRFPECQSIQQLTLTLFGFDGDGSVENHEAIYESIRGGLERHGGIRHFTLLWGSDYGISPSLQLLAPHVHALQMARLSRLVTTTTIVNNNHNQQEEEEEEEDTGGRRRNRSLRTAKAAAGPMSLYALLSKCRQLTSLQFMDMVNLPPCVLDCMADAMIHHLPTLECLKLQHADIVTHYDWIVHILEHCPSILHVDGILPNHGTGSGGLCLTRGQQEKLFHHVKLNQIRHGELLKLNGFPLGLWPQLLQDLDEGEWYSVMYKLIREKHDMLIQHT